MAMRIKLIIGLIALAVVLVWSIVSVYPDWLWFRNLDFSPVFWTMLISKFGFGLIVWVLLIMILTVNIIMAQRISRKVGRPSVGEDGTPSFYGLSGYKFTLFLFVVVLVGSLVIASKGSAHWDMVLRYLYQQPFGTRDPIFQLDLGFYMFTLPLYIYIREGLIVLLLFSGAITIIWYMKEGILQVIGEASSSQGAPPSLPKFIIHEKVIKHLMFLGGILVIIIAWGYYLKIYGFLYSTQGPAFGASYTDVHVKILINKVLIIITLAFSVVMFLNVKKFKKKQVLLSAAIWIVSILLLGKGIPFIVQQFVVRPNELTKEREYIGYNIAHTREAYNLNKIAEVDFQADDQLSVDDLEKNEVTIENIRIWDERPLLKTYRQIQAIRLYYDFNNVDVGRYMINGRYRQVMLAVREMVVNQLPLQANTWVNRHLTYTHGYGLASSPVNEVTREGLPRLFIKDLPPTFEPDLKIDRPEIYYGEKTGQYVLVGTKNQEFDYPKGDKNVYTTYEGKGGVPCGNLARRMLFAAEFLDPQILFTGYLTPESRIMFKRRIDRRAGAVAPFLDYDGDPYVVVSGGKLYWILDAYTTSNMYPYSSRSQGYFNKKAINYIRNSVKVTIDAYNGDICFYLMDNKDPIVKTYAKIFPDLFKPFEDMPSDLKKHIRYPKDLLKIQADTYRNYHMQEAQVFYNQEDLWQIPDEVYGDTRQEMEPYYIIIKLPQGQKEEFLLMLPFTPSKKDNMIGWLAARSDIPNYGSLIVYKLPKDKLVYGPMQIEARVDQQTEISRELSLWGQRGSRVIRGNLLAIPVAQTFIYVEPVYLEAKQEEAEKSDPRQQGRTRFGKRRGSALQGERKKSVAASLPELKRVIAGFSNRIVMGQNLDDALRKVLERERLAIPKTKVPTPEVKPVKPSDNLAARALEHYERAKQYLREENWAGYGKELESLEEILKKLSEEDK
jgi:uncharacterized membrane protein (UPF0182 family)